MCVHIMGDEICVIKENDMLEVTTLREDTNQISLKWAYTTELNEDIDNEGLYGGE